MPRLLQKAAYKPIVGAVYTLLLTGFLLVGSFNAEAQSILGAAAYRFATQKEFNGVFPYDTCDPDLCSYFGTVGGAAYTSDIYIAYQ